MALPVIELRPNQAIDDDADHNVIEDDMKLTSLSKLRSWTGW